MRAEKQIAMQNMRVASWQEMSSKRTEPVLGTPPKNHKFEPRKPHDKVPESILSKQIDI